MNLDLICSDFRVAHREERALIQIICICSQTSMSVYPLIATKERTSRDVSNVPKPDVLARLFLDRKWRATADEDGHYSLAFPL